MQLNGEREYTCDTNVRRETKKGQKEERKKHQHVPYAMSYVSEKSCTEFPDFYFVEAEKCVFSGVCFSADVSKLSSS